MSIFRIEDGVNNNVIVGVGFEDICVVEGHSVGVEPRRGVENTRVRRRDDVADDRFLSVLDVGLASVTFSPPFSF